MSVANQKIVRIGKRVARDPTHLYAKINIDAMQYAYATLSRSGLGLWLYFNKNQDDYQLELSQKACAEWGIKKDSYYNGVNELIRFGFLVPISEGSNIYTFYETPLSEIANISNFTICILYDGNNGLCVAEYALQLVQSCLKDVKKK